MILDRIFQITRAQSEPPAERREFSLGRWIQWLDKVVTGEFSTSAGIELSTDGALGVSTVYACVREVAEAVSTLPLITYRRLPNDGKRREKNHPLYQLLRHRPHPRISAWEYWDYVMQCLLLRGNAYSRIVRNNRGDIDRLIPYHPDRINPVFRDGDLYFEFRPPNNNQVEIIPANQMFRIRGPLSVDGVTGLNVIALLKDPIGHTLAQDMYSSKMYSKGARLSGVLKYPGKIHGEDNYNRLRDSFERMTTGVDNVNRVAILEQGMEFQSISMTAEQVQLLESRKFQVEEICRIFGVPPHKVSHLYQATFNNIEHQDLEWVRDSVRPWLVRIEQSIHRDLLSEKEQESEKIFAEFLLDGMLRGDTKTRHESYALGRQWGYLSINDIRRLENMNPIPEGGDDYLMPTNMKVIGEPDPEPPAQPVPPPVPEENQGNQANDDEDDPAPPAEQKRFEIDLYSRLSSSMRHVFYESLGRLVRKEAAAIERAAKKHALPAGISDFRTWSEGFYREHQDLIQQTMGPVFQTYAEARFGVSDDQVARYVERFAARYCQEHRDELLSNAAADPPGLKSLLYCWSHDRIGDIYLREMDDFSQFLLGQMDTRGEN